MPEIRPGLVRFATIVGLAALTLGLGSGRPGRLTYHEAFVAQAAREMIAGGDVLVPTIAGRPWLEKPPLAIWLVALVGRSVGCVDECVARVPSAVGGGAAGPGGGGTGRAAVRAGGRGARRAGPGDDGLDGLAGEAGRGRHAPGLPGRRGRSWRSTGCGKSAGPGAAWRWAFFVGLGLMSLAKGIGFGAVLVGAVDRPGPGVGPRPGDAPAAVVAPGVVPGGGSGAGLAGPGGGAAPVGGGALDACTSTDRLAARSEHFAGGPWWQYGPAVLWQVLPWTPLALVGAWRSMGRAVRDRGGRRSPALGLGGRAGGPAVDGDGQARPLRDPRPAAVVDLGGPGPVAAGRPAPGAGLGARPAPEVRGGRVRGPGAGLRLGFAVLGPRLDRRGVEWAFYEDGGPEPAPGEPLALLYDDWDRAPYPTPFGPVPHDLAVRLYLPRPPRLLATGGRGAAPPIPPPAPSPFAVIARERDLPALRRIGRVETVAHGPTLRARASRVDDRAFFLFRVNPGRLATEDTGGHGEENERK